MMSVLLSLVLAAALLLGEWFYVQTFFGYVEPALIVRVERALGVEIGFGPFHHWEVRATRPERSAPTRVALSVAVFTIHLVVMMGFAVGGLVAALMILGPAIWLHRRGSSGSLDG